MTRLILDDVTPGMVLNEAVTNNKGQILLAAGAELTEKHIRAMKMWGIMDIGVEDTEGSNDDETNEPIDPELLEKAKKAIKEKFSLTDINSEIMQTIFNRAAIEYAKENKGKLNEA